MSGDTRKKKMTAPSAGRSSGAAAYLLWFRREELDPGEADILIGVYSSEEKAKGAIERLRGKAGFVDFPEGFEIAPYTIDHDYWEEGYKFVD
jgi:hypothetical protein